MYIRNKPANGGFFFFLLPHRHSERSAETTGEQSRFADPLCLPRIATSPHRSLLPAAPRKYDGVRRVSGGLSKIK